MTMTKDECGWSRGKLNLHAHVQAAWTHSWESICVQASSMMLGAGIRYRARHTRSRRSIPCCVLQTSIELLDKARVWAYIRMWQCTALPWGMAPCQQMHEDKEQVRMMPHHVMVSAEAINPLLLSCPSQPY
jgi:hypothetical protein